MVSTDIQLVLLASNQTWGSCCLILNGWFGYVLFSQSCFIGFFVKSLPVASKSIPQKCTQLKEISIRCHIFPLPCFVPWFSSDCPADRRTWVSFKDKCYHFVHGEEDKIKSYTFESAKTLCRGFGTWDILMFKYFVKDKMTNGLFSHCVCVWFGCHSLLCFL